MTKHELRMLLRDQGYVFYRQARGSHQLWRHKKTGRKVTVCLAKHFGDPRALHNFIDVLRRH